MFFLNNWKLIKLLLCEKMLTHFIQFYNPLQKFVQKKKLLFCIRSKVIHVFVTSLLPLALDEHVLKRARLVIVWLKTIDIIIIISH